MNENFSGRDHHQIVCDGCYANGSYVCFPAAGYFSLAAAGSKKPHSSGADSINILGSKKYSRAVEVAQVVAHRTVDQEVPGSIPAGSWAFSSSLSHQACVLNQFPHGGALIFLYKMLSCAA